MPTPLVQAAVLGVASGMRAAVAPALVAHHLSRTGNGRTDPDADLDLGRLSFMRSRRTAAAFKLAAAGELVGDKLPATPDRTDAGPLFGRALSGALCGAALYGAAGERKALGALVGAASAVVGAYAFYHLRRSLGEEGVPDLAAAVAEDALVLAGGAQALGNR